MGRSYLVNAPAHSPTTCRLYNNVLQQLKTSSGDHENSVARFWNRKKPLSYALLSGLVAVATFLTLFLVLQIYIAVAANGLDVEGPALELGATVAAFFLAGFIFGRRHACGLDYSLVAAIPPGILLVVLVVNVERVPFSLALKLAVGGGVAFLCHWLGSLVGHRAERRKQRAEGDLGL